MSVLLKLTLISALFIPIVVAEPMVYQSLNIIQLRNHPKLNHKLISQEQGSRGSFFWQDDMEGFGLWVEAEGPTQPLNDKDELEKLLKVIAENPLTNIYVQVYRNGRSWFASQYADDEPFKKNNENGIDPLRSILNAAAKKDEPPKVHVWFNTLRLGDDKNAKVFSFLGKDAVLVSSRGESLFDNAGYGNKNCRPDTPGIWLDANNNNVSSLLLKVFSEVKGQYPEISGVHLDMIRTPFPYSPTEVIDPSCSRFLSKNEFENKVHLRGLATESQVEEFDQEPLKDGPINVVKKFRTKINRDYPKMKLTAAVLSNQKIAKSHARQEWSYWIKEDLVDSVVTMTYAENMDRFKREVDAVKKFGSDKVSIGVGAWLALSQPKLLKTQMEYVKDSGLSEVVLFSSGNLSNKKGEVLYQIAREVIDD